ncbi:hypothetical protein LSTR_LSTR001039 [Laodelphax striatellus]|uniref:Uncharacterized protein n=1 Tax=Laodelphax striatellus TaxID=195883 RepID=A0A482X1W7_LAOST|nr:hypothetical protein LSTR_LSTR001039 [Laodelphax striatellus]
MGSVFTANADQWQRGFPHHSTRFIHEKRGPKVGIGIKRVSCPPRRHTASATLLIHWIVDEFTIVTKEEAFQ